LTISRIRETATAVEKMNTVAAIAVGLPILSIAVVMRISRARTKMTNHWSEAIFI